MTSRQPMKQQNPYRSQYPNLGFTGKRDYALYLDEIPRFSSFLILALFCFLSKDFLRSGAFHDDEKIWFRKRDHGCECRQKNMDYDTSAVY